MKLKIILTLFTFMLLLAFGSAAHAENLYDYYEDVTESDLKNSMILSPKSSLAFINGKEVTAVQPMVKDGRVLLPLRFISEGFGAKVDFNAKNQSISIKYANTTISMKVGDSNISINGKSSKMDVPASIYKNSTYIPLRTIGEALNKKVIYLNDIGFRKNSVLIIRDTNGVAIENSRLIRAYDLLLQGKSIVYSDRYMSVVKENGQLLASDNYHNFSPLTYKEFVKEKNVTRLGDIWFSTDIGNFYMHYSFDTTSEFILYRVDEEEITRVAIEGAQIKEVRTYLNDVYYLIQYGRGIVDPDKTTNLKHATFSNGKWSSDYLGKAGFYYGFDSLGEPYNWKIDSEGIYIFGYDRFGDLTSDERRKTFGDYRVDLKGYDQELMTP